MEKWKKNDLVETMQTVGLDPLQFELEENDGGQVRIKHKCSPSCFTFRYDGGLITGSSVVGDGLEWQSVPSSSWQALLPPERLHERLYLANDEGVAFRVRTNRR